MGLNDFLSLCRHFLVPLLFHIPYIPHKIREMIFLQWNLRIKDTLGQGDLSFIERFPFFGG